MPNGHTVCGRCRTTLPAGGGQRGARCPNCGRPAGAGGSVLMLGAAVLAVVVVALLGVGALFAFQPRPSRPSDPVAKATVKWVSSLPVAEEVSDARPPSTQRPEALPPSPTKPASPEPASPPSDAPPVKRDSRGFVVHALAKRVDLRTADELEKELLAAREVALESGKGPSLAGQMRLLAVKQKEVRQPYPGAAVAAAGRPDLAGLPFRLGPDAAQSLDRAQAMSALSGQLREAVQGCVRPGSDPRPDTNQLFATLLGEGSKGLLDRKAWASSEAVPCIQQMLLAENREVRRMSCELLRRLDVPEATEALARCAVFDTDPGNRAAAVDALRGRPKPGVTVQLMRYLRYPWPRAAEHAAEALVALDCTDAVPALAAVYDLPDPIAPFTVKLPGRGSGLYRREVVRVNHLRNCMLCHPPSLADTDLIRGAVPDPDRPLGGPVTPSYYRSGDAFVTAATTYLQQDFSQVQPVANPGKWPDHQRFDYFVAVSAVKGSPAPASDAAYKDAVRFALRELTGRNPDRADDLSWLSRQPGMRPDATASDGRAETALLLALQNDPLAYFALKYQDFTRPLLSMPADDLRAGVLAMVKAFGAADTRIAMIAYLDPLSRTGEPARREKAARLLGVAVSATEKELAAEMFAAAKAMAADGSAAAKMDALDPATVRKATVPADAQNPVLLGSAKFFVSAAATSDDLRVRWEKEGELWVLTADTGVEVIGRDAEFWEVSLGGKRWFLEAKRVPAELR